MLLKLSSYNYRHALAITIISLCMFWAALFSSQNNPLQLASDFFGFFFLGIGGAIAANSTGAGGGVVFVPSFDALGMAIDEVIATSFAIQCFGMSVGSISWLIFFNGKAEKVETADLLNQTLIEGVYFIFHLSAFNFRMCVC